MRTLALILILLGFATHLCAAKVVTVAQLEEFLTASPTRTDADLARQISELQLGERLSPEKFERLNAKMPGAKSREALIALADVSAFLAPPAAETPSVPAPDVAEQRRIMGLVVGYVGKVIPQLPNFFATRVTTRFEDTPLMQNPVGGFIPHEPIHLLDETTAKVLYRDGREVVDSGSAKNKPQPMTAGLNTWGVFGPILGIVLVDAAQSNLVWSHWEQGANGLEAVFRYSVPKEKSHYEVNYCCVAEQAAAASANVHPFRQLAGYHGEMSVDPETGTILRLTLEADMKTADPVVKAAIVVEYGTVEIGGSKYVCPVRSVSTTLAQTVQVDPRYKFAVANALQPLKTSLSDTRFEHYHVFRVESRVVEGDVTELKPLADASKSTEADSAASASTASVSPTENSEPIVQAPEQAATVAAPPAPVTAQPTPAPLPEISAATTQGLPEVEEVDRTTISADSPNPGFTLRSTTRLVDVGVVAFDKKGHAITDLKAEDFEIFDNGARQHVRFFSQPNQTGTAVAGAGAAMTKSDAAPTVYSNRRAAEPSQKMQTSQPENSTTVLLIDSSNLAWGDLSYARGEMLRFVKSLSSGESVGLFALKGAGFQILLEPTLNRAQLADQLSHWMPNALDLARAQQEEQRNRQQIEYVQNVSDLLYTNGNLPNDGTRVVDPQLRALGSNPARDFLAILPGIARHLAVMPGHKSLIWISSDNVLADWSDTAPSIEKGSSHIDPLLLNAQEALNEAYVSLYALDASQLEGGVVAASLPHGNVQLSPTVNAATQMATLPPGQREEVQEALDKSNRDINSGRLTAQMHQDTHPIQGMFRELADATGGRALRRAGDIAGELNAVVADGRGVYQLSFVPDSPADDTYHHLTLKVAGRKDIALRYRGGYLYSREPATIKTSFEQATWQPRDVTDIGITARSQTASNGSTLTLNILAADLAMKQEGGLWTDKLDIFLMERDDAALRCKITGKTLGLRLKPGTYERVLRDGIEVFQPVNAKSGSGSVRVVIVDENSGRMGSVTIPGEALNR